MIKEEDKMQTKGKYSERRRNLAFEISLSDQDKKHQENMDSGTESIYCIHNCEYSSVIK